MKNIVAVLGIFACVLSACVTVSSLLIPTALSPFSSFFCEKDERLTGEVWTTSSVNRSSVGTTYFCVDESGNERAVTGQVMNSTTNLFLVLMFGGMGLLAVAGWQAVSKEPKAVKSKRKNDEEMGINQPQAFTTGDGVTVITASSEIPAADITTASETTKRLFDMLNENMPLMTQSGKSFDLTDALQELEDARTKGLISEDEYQRLRQKVMDRFG